MKIMPVYILILLFLTGCSSSDKPSWQGYVEGENIYLASPDSGKLIELAVTRGQPVNKNQLLFKLDPEPQISVLNQYKNEYLQAMHILQDLKNPRRDMEIAAIKAQIEQTDADIQLASMRVDRYTKLYEKKAIDQDSLDAVVANLRHQEQLKAQYEANYKLAHEGSRVEQIAAQQKQIAALAARLNEAKWQLSQKQIQSPAAGTVFDTFYRQGEFVGAGQAVLALLTPENIRIEFFVPAQDLPLLKVDQLIDVRCYSCQDKAESHITYISPEAEYIPPLVYSRDNADKLVFRIKASISNPQYKPGEPVMVYLK